MEDGRVTFTFFRNAETQIITSSNTEDNNDHANPKTVQKTISTKTFSNAWLTFMCNVAGIIHFYATFREIAPNEMNIQKDDALFVVNVAFCDFFNAMGKIFWSYFSIYKAQGKAYF